MCCADNNFTLALINVVSIIVVALTGFGGIFWTHRLAQKRDARKLELDKKVELVICLINHCKMLEKEFGILIFCAKIEASFDHFMKGKDEYAKRRGKQEQYKINVLAAIYYPEWKILFDKFFDEGDRVYEIEEKYVMDPNNFDMDKDLKLFKSRLDIFSEIGDKLIKKIIKDIRGTKKHT